MLVIVSMSSALNAKVILTADDIWYIPGNVLRADTVICCLLPKLERAYKKLSYHPNIFPTITTENDFTVQTS